MGAMRCWWCGAKAEPVEVSTLTDPVPRYMPGRWLTSDRSHDHAVEPPTPGDLEDAGHRALTRIRELAWP